MYFLRPDDRDPPNLSTAIRLHTQGTKPCLAANFIYRLLKHSDTLYSERERFSMSAQWHTQMQFVLLVCLHAHTLSSPDSQYTVAKIHHDQSDFFQADPANRMLTVTMITANIRFGLNDSDFTH
jgi:hypothetical protein